MDYRPLGTTDLRVSALGLGTMTWGVQCDEAEAHAQLDRALELGITFVDAAEMYPTPPAAETFGLTESIIGAWLARRPGARARIVLASKVTGANNQLPHIRDGTGRLDRANIVAAVEGSLRRLRTDAIDLYYSHSPARPANVFGRLDYPLDGAADLTPVEETAAAMAELVRAGKIRHFAVSNETPWGAMRQLALAEAGSGARPQAVQNAYNLLNRAYEVGLSEISLRERCGLVAYSPLAGGVLTGKYLDGAMPPGCRFTRFERFRPRYFKPRAQPAVAAYVRLAREAGLDPAQMALAFVLSRPFVTAALPGQTSLAQLEHNAGAAALVLPADLRAAIDRVHADHPNPCP